jgi:hypothetical protein
MAVERRRGAYSTQTDRRLIVTTTMILRLPPGRAGLSSIEASVVHHSVNLKISQSSLSNILIGVG